MQEIRIFDGIAPQSVEQMLKCFSAGRHRYPSETAVLNYAGTMGPICVVLSGSVEIECLDADGNLSVLESLAQDDVFGELFSPPTEPLVYTAVTKSPSEILFIDYGRVISHCENACSHHNQLVNNLFRISARKAQHLSKRISLLSQRTLRQKLLLYLHYASAEVGERAFEIPFSLSKLADYLAADRSAMMRELARMREEGLLRSSGRHFELP